MGTRVWRVLRPGSTSVSVTVVFVAHETSAFFHFVLATVWATWILVHYKGIVTNGEPICGPFPYVSHHIVESKSIWRKLGDRTS